MKKKNKQTNKLFAYKSQTNKAENVATSESNETDGSLTSFIAFGHMCKFSSKYWCQGKKDVVHSNMTWCCRCSLLWKPFEF